MHYRLLPPSFDGLNVGDVLKGIFKKRIMLVEDNTYTRLQIERHFNYSALPIVSAPDYESALELIRPEHNNPIFYAIIDNAFPQKRNEEPKNLADKFIEELKERHPQARIFGYVDDDKAINNANYIHVLKKDSVPVDRLYHIIIQDSKRIIK